jgi:hypothetical protein
MTKLAASLIRGSNFGAIRLVALAASPSAPESAQRANAARLARASGAGAADRFLWARLSQLWRGWRSVLVIVKPETVIRWHRMNFGYFRRNRPTAA